MKIVFTKNSVRQKLYSQLGEGTDRRAGQVSCREPASEEAKLMARLLDSKPSLDDPMARPAPWKRAFGMSASAPCSQPQTLGGLRAVLLPPLLMESGRMALSCSPSLPGYASSEMLATVLTSFRGKGQASMGG